ncbi:GMC family oxidoreductase [Stenotrophobium rhamnosiphilum]|uniref:Choline dehydrogenase n=1 Tax=Stenotrophobium rhamnosiphilum TaxID=2029166 RepID=A0A2T5MJC7_9GAMM|nr:GMC family oxidoreductase N-terminal domain-containing protein [Stenotrophobium rhamnosiphilum]PTU32681.1 choline dehydrogenase [Stenotrophobium rhamnosiphilum]
MKEFGSYDYIIVGGGTAGCALANRLSQDPDVSVLLLEAGGKDNWIWIHIPVGYLYCIGNPRTDWCYRTEAEQGLGGRSILYARGRVLGGSSSINAMIYMRGQTRDYDEWAQLSGDDSWRWDQVLPLFKRSEDHWRGGDDFHGSGGELRVEQQRLRWDILDRFADAAEQAGIPRTADFNTGDNNGSGKFEVTQRRGVRWNAVKAFLRPALKRPNLRIVTGALIDQLSFNGTRVSGVKFSLGGETFQASARIETVLAAGSIGSPAILQRSGIGNADQLATLGIPLRSDLPGVGANLQDHLQLRSIYQIEGIRSLNQLANSRFGQMRMGLEYLYRRRGPLSMAPSQLGAFTRSDPTQTTPNLEYHVQPLSLDKFGDPLHRFPAFTASVCALRPTSRGSATIVSREAADAPQIAPRYLSTDVDRKIAADALRLTRHIVSMPALAPYKPKEYLPGPHYDSDEALAVAAGLVGTTIFHPVGTCKMGRADDASAVVDTRLRVRGVQGLRVADASIMPTITSGNTNAPTLMIAEKAAQMIREDRLANTN